MVNLHLKKENFVRNIVMKNIHNSFAKEVDLLMNIFNLKLITLVKNIKCMID